MFNEKLTEESIIQFDCTCCGRCCKSGLDVFLNPLDVWNVRNDFKKPTTFLKDNHLLFETRFEYGAYPLCLIRMRKDVCIFHKDNLCSIHHARPAACRFYPVLHYYDANRDSSLAFTPDKDECTGCRADKQYSVMGWLLINSYAAYHRIMEFTPSLAPLCQMQLDKERSDAFFDVLFNFDNCADFPFIGEYPAVDRDSADRFVEWVINKTKALLEKMNQ